MQLTATANRWTRREYKLGLAQRMRNAPTESEAKAWSLLRKHQIFGLKFRRQRLLHGFIVDFYCPQHLLALEIDGPIHDTPENQIAGIHRSLILESQGIRLIRIPNHLVTLTHLTDTIARAIAQSTPRFEHPIPAHRNKPPST